ncbi:MAG TPA: ATP-binding protein [Flavisolibacter sp.]|nr:ATP-binding protein [Flavisolibacter sp.]
MEARNRSIQDYEYELEQLRLQLEEANETIEAIRTGQVDAIVVQGDNGHQLYTLKSADHTYRVFIEKMTEGAVTLNHEGLILYCNSSFAFMANTPLSHIIGMDFEQFIAHENMPLFEELFVQSWKEDSKGELNLVHGNKLLPVQLSLTALELDEGKALSIIVTDLSRQKNNEQQLRDKNEQLAKMNEALEVSNNDLQQFASVASHDLQEPLRKIMVFSNILKDKCGAELSADSRHYLNKIIDASGRMKALIIEILNYSRLSENNTELQVVDLNDLVKELMDDFEMAIKDKKASIQVGTLPLLQVNRGQMRQVFQNIISNALKFQRPGVEPLITINSKLINSFSFDSVEDPNGAYSLISIRDNGIGFQEKFATDIFALFERLNPKDKYEGTGIGLAIAKKIVEKHNGLIKATSNETDGSHFMIILPRNQR